MKRIIAFVFALFMLVLPVSAEQSDDSIILDYVEGLTLCTPDSIPSSDGMIFGIKEEEFKKYLTENRILLYGFDNSNAFVFELTGEKTDFTESIGDFSNIKEADIKDFADTSLSSVYSIENISGTVYVVTDNVSDSGSEYITRQYITVKHGRLYIMTFTVPGSSVKKDVGERIDRIINGLTFGGDEIPEKVSVYSVIGVAVLVSAVAVLAVYILITVILDIRKRNSEKVKSDNF